MLPAVAVVVGIMLLLWKFAYNENDFSNDLTDF